jgi:hypothetical protein
MPALAQTHTHMHKQKERNERTNVVNSNVGRQNQRKILHALNERTTSIKIQAAACVRFLAEISHSSVFFHFESLTRKFKKAERRSGRKIIHECHGAFNDGFFSLSNNKR